MNDLNGNTMAGPSSRRSPRILRASESAILLEYERLEDVIANEIALRGAELPGVTELVPAARTILVRFDPREISPRSLAAAVRELDPASTSEDTSSPTEIDVVYDGADLEFVAEYLGVSADALVARHTAAAWRVAFVGFAPGFAYCVGDDSLFAVPRRATPRTRVPKGSVALAAEFSAVYPGDSPGGWQLIGRTGEPMWDLDRAQPARLEPGATVRYRSVRETAGNVSARSREDTKRVRADETTGAATAASPLAFLEVLNPGAQALVEDLGRPGKLHLGVPESGAVDRGSLRAANRAVGNDEHAACLELAGGGAEFRVQATSVIAITGALAEHRILTETGEELSIAAGEATAVDPGDTITIGIPERGMRAYLAVRGGFDCERVMGSASTDTLAGVGPKPLRAGDRLPISRTQPRRPVLIHGGPGHAPGLSDGVTELSVLPGPRDDWFAPEALTALAEQDWEVTPSSNRVGMRLSGATPLEWRGRDELASEGAVTGAIQVPPDGQPVLFLADHPVTGGYPIIGAVADEQLDALGQLAPGDRVRFRVLPEAGRGQHGNAPYDQGAGGVAP